MSRFQRAAQGECLPAGALRRAMRRCAATRTAMVAVLVGVAVALAAELGPLLPAGGDALHALGGAMHAHPFANQDASFAANLVDALRDSLAVAIGGTALAWLIGSALGVVAAASPRIVRAGILGIARLQGSFPELLLAVAGVALVRPRIGGWVAVLGLLLWPRFARATCDAWRSETVKGHVQAARSLLLSPMRIVVRHGLPNVVPTTLPALFASLGHALSLDAAIGVLGLREPDGSATLGDMLGAGDMGAVAAGATLAVLVVAAFTVAGSVREEGLRA